MTITPGATVKPSAPCPGTAAATSRVVDQWWFKYSGGGTVSATLDRFQLGYDQDSNVLYRKNISSTNNSELYHANGTSAGYDSLNRLTSFQRGALNSGNNSISGATATRSWTLDTQGNWSQNPAGNTYAVNGQNQYTSISSAGSSSSSGSGTTLNFAYDNDGNMTTRVDSSGIGNANYTPDTLQFDAWDRLTRLVHSVPNGGNPFGWTEQDFDIDALGRRCQVVVTGNSICTSTPSDDLYYSTDFQVLEDDRSVALDGGTGTGWTRSQYVWSPTYVNDLVLRDRDTNHDNGFAERLYVQQDANHNVTSLTNASGTISVQQRFVYDPYGSATVLNASWSSTSDSYNWIYLFQGGRWDSYAGLYDFQRREYDPTLGRSVQQDPTGTQYVNGANLYQFANGGPVNHVDPTGLACTESYDAVHARVNQTIGALQSGNYSLADLQSLRNDMRTLGYDDGAIHDALDPYIAPLSQRLNLNDAEFQGLNDLVDRMATRPTKVLEGWFVDAPVGVYNSVRHPLDSADKLAELIIAYEDDPKAVSDAIIAQAKTERGAGALFGGIAWGAVLGKVPGVVVARAASLIGRATAEEGAALGALEEGAAEQAASAPARLAARDAAFEASTTDLGMPASVPPNAGPVEGLGAAIAKWLGPYDVKRFDADGFVALSKSALRRFRMDFEGHGDVPHAHLEVFDAAEGGYVDAPGVPHRIPFQE